MAQTIKLKRSATAGNTPTTSQLALGELGINTTDGKLFLKKSVSGTESIVDVGDTSGYLPLSGGTLTGSIDVTGSVTADGLTVDGTNGAYTIASNGNDFYYGRNGANYHIAGTTNGAFNFLTGASSANRLKIASNGDISFYDGSGNQGLFWDSSTSRLGLGTTAPAVDLDVRSNSVSNPAFISTGNSDGSEFVTLYGGTSVDQKSAIWWDSGQSELKFGTATSKVGASESIKMTIKSTGNVGIGESIPTEKLHVGGNIKMQASTAIVTYQNAVNTWNLGLDAADASFKFKDGTDERLRLTADGNFLIGKTSASYSTAGQEFRQGGATILGRSGAEPLILNRLTSDGGILSFRKDNTTVGNISSVGGTDIKVTFSSDGDQYITGNSAANYLSFSAANQERMRIDASGNVGIGVSSTNVNGYKTLNVGAGTIGSIIKLDGVSSGHYHRILNNNGQLFIQADQGNTTGNSAIVFGVDAAERMRIDSSGNLIVSGTAAGQATSVALHNGGYVHAVSSHQMAGIFDRRDSDGDILVFRKDGSGTAVGSIGVVGGSIIFGRGDTALAVNDGLDAVYPIQANGTPRDGAIDLGRSGTSGRFKDAYLSGGVYGGGAFSAGTTGNGNFFAEGAQHIFRKGSSGSYAEFGRFDTSGNLLVGKTVLGVGVDGAQFIVGGYSGVSATNNPSFFANRNGGDGSVLEVGKNGVSVGSIGTRVGSLLIGTGAVGLWFVESGDDRIIPRNTNGGAANNLIDLGDSGSAFKDLYLSGNATAQKLTLTKSPVGTFTIEVDGTNTGQPNLIVKKGTSEALRVDNSNNLLVGTTSTGINTSSSVKGHNFFEHGYVVHARSGQTVMSLNRQTNDGTIADFRKDGTGRGALSLITGDLCIHSTTSDHSGLRFANGAIHPTDHTGAQSDSAQIDLGSGSYRFNDIYARNSTILTSDRNEKQDIEELSDVEQRVAVRAKGLLRKFKWKDAVAEKGDDARIHFGIVAQDLQAAFVAEGLDAGDYGVFISNTWTNEDGEEQTRMGVRYSELLAFIISAI